MTRHQRFDVRVAAEVRQALSQVRSPTENIRLRAAFLTATERLEQYGTRTRGVKKLRGVDLWEIRLGDYRAFFCMIPGSSKIALASLVSKRRRRFPMARLQLIERRAHQWRDIVKEME